MEIQNLYEDYDNLDKRENVSNIYTAASKLAPVISQLTHRIKNGDTVMTGEEIDALNLPFSQGMLPSDNIKPSDIYTALDKELDIGLSTYGYEGEDISFLFDFYNEHQRMPFLYSDKKGATQKDHAMGRIQDLQNVVSSKTGVISTNLSDAEEAFEEFAETMEKDYGILNWWDDEGYKEFANTIEGKYKDATYRGDDIRDWYTGTNYGPASPVEGTVRSAGGVINWEKTYSLNEEGLEGLNLLFDTFHHDTYIPNQQELDDLVNATERYIANYKTGSSKSEAIWSGDPEEQHSFGGLGGYLENVNEAREALKELDYIKTLLKSQNKLVQGA